MKKIICFIILATTFSVCYFTCGFFIIQPIGAIPEGKTIVYFRYQTNMPFISSADGIMDKSGGGVSIFGRAIAMGTILTELKDKQICRLPYSKTLYLISTGGKEYQK